MTLVIQSTQDKSTLIGRLDNGAISLATAIYTIAEDSWGIGGLIAAFACRIAAFVVDVFKVKGVDVAGDVTVEMNVSFRSLYTLKTLQSWLKKQRLKISENTRVGNME